MVLSFSGSIRPHLAVLFSHVWENGATLAQSRQSINRRCWRKRRSKTRRPPEIREIPRCRRWCTDWHFFMRGAVQVICDIYKKYGDICAKRGDRREESSSGLVLVGVRGGVVVFGRGRATIHLDIIWSFPDNTSKLHTWCEIDRGTSPEWVAHWLSVLSCSGRSEGI